MSACRGQGISLEFIAELAKGCIFCQGCRLPACEQVDRRRRVGADGSAVVADRDSVCHCEVTEHLCWAVPEELCQPWVDESDSLPLQGPVRIAQQAGCLWVQSLPFGLFGPGSLLLHEFVLLLGCRGCLLLLLPGCLLGSLILLLLGCLAACLLAFADDRRTKLEEPLLC